MPERGNARAANPGAKDEREADLRVAQALTVAEVPSPRRRFGLRLFVINMLARLAWFLWNLAEALR
jgi:hypothetical protein